MTANNFYSPFSWRCLFVLLFLFSAIPAQTNSRAKLPKEIRGYKVHKATVLVIDAREKESAKKNDDIDSLVKVGVPQNFKFSLSGATFELPMSMNNYKASGRIEFITFEDLKANGIKMQVAEFNEPFDIEKGAMFDLPNPIKVSVSAKDQTNIAN